MELTNIQKQIITTKESKVLVSSSAAAGKTACLVARIKYLLDSGIKPSEIVAITFTNNAASVMYERLGYPNGLFIGTVHSYCNYLLRGGAIDTTDIIQQERFDDLFEEIKQNPQCIKPIKYFLSDETQDCTGQQFEFYEMLKPENYMYFFDLKQQIYDFNGSDPTHLIELLHDPDVTVYKMTQNFRNLSDILRFAKKFLYRLGPDYNDDSIPMRRQEDEMSFHVLEGNYTPSEAVETLIRINNNLGAEWKDWFVLCRTNKDVELFQFLFGKRDIPTDTFKQGDLSNSEINKKLNENTIKVLTAHSAKGMENKYVLSYNIRAYNDNEARLCYVAATRAKDFLIWAKMPSKKKLKAKITNWE